MGKAFCQICRHPSEEGEGHEEDCPVYTGEPVHGTNVWLRQGAIPLDDGYEVAKIYREGRERLLEELRAQVEVNRRLGRDLIEVRLELAALKMKDAGNSEPR